MFVMIIDHTRVLGRGGYPIATTTAVPTEDSAITMCTESRKCI